MKIIVIIVTCLLFSTGLASAAEELIVLEDSVTIIKQDSIFVGQDEYIIVTEEMAIENPDLVVTKYWDGALGQHPINFFMLYSVGYIDLAEVTIEKNYVRQIKVITLMQ